MFKAQGALDSEVDKLLAYFGIAVDRVMIRA